MISTRRTKPRADHVRFGTRKALARRLRLDVPMMTDAAIAAPARLVDGHDVELWRAGRKVTTFDA